MNVKDKCIVITGGSGGLGSEMAKLLAFKGANVIILDLDKQKGDALVKDIQSEGYKAIFYPMDLTSEEDWKTVLTTIMKKDGKIDVLVNNVGINIRKPLEEMELEEWNTMMLVNVGSVFLGAKHMIPIMRKQGGGAIINTSSVCGLIGHRYTPEAYTTTKGAVTLLTKSIAARYAKDGIRCNSIHPSTVDTPLVQEMFKDPVKKQQRLEEVPLGRLAKASDVANAVLYLASDDASFINGIALPIDGGVICC
ncbi:SDR family oxidoreductase [Oceanispirochaeta crateris]|uniref:SDR family oxidoreductase n=1 Tax=Oceanispirochaeta crateris TaxID=2518645 RepID=A0A5C1QT39_9SPIO|nr:SDR family oxidoreductase [Oceanispirochaeta crateris]QEN09182.1 SDR family oxidoreductase [Oceanispirochaeta crateris]